MVVVVRVTARDHARALGAGQVAQRHQCASSAAMPQAISTPRSRFNTGLTSHAPRNHVRGVLAMEIPRLRIVHR